MGWQRRRRQGRLVSMTVLLLNLFCVTIRNANAGHAPRLIGR
jgi:hypothetical protein